MEVRETLSLVSDLKEIMNSLQVHRNRHSLLMTDLWRMSPEGAKQMRADINVLRSVLGLGTEGDDRRIGTVVADIVRERDELKQSAEVSKREIARLTRALARAKRTAPKKKGRR